MRHKRICLTMVMVAVIICSMFMVGCADNKLSNMATPVIMIAESDRTIVLKDANGTVFSLPLNDDTYKAIAESYDVGDVVLKEPER